MSEKENLGMTEQVNETKELSPAEKAKKKKAKYALVKVIVALCAILCVVLTVFEMGFTYRTIKAAEVDGTQYSVAEYNWMYTNSLYEVYSDYYQRYGELAAYILNPQAGLSEQDYNEDMTWAEYIKEYTDDKLIEMTKLYDAAKAEGFEMPEENYEFIDSEWESIETSAASYGYTADALVEINYGRGVNEKVFRDMYERYLCAISYVSNIAIETEVTEEDIDAYYEEHKEDIDCISYAAYYADGTAAEGEDAEAAKAEAKADAEAVLAGTKDATYSEFTYATKNSIDELFTEWLFDDARAEGDKEIFESTNGYYVIEFRGYDDLHYNTVDVRHILVQPEDSSNEESVAEALEKAESYVAEWEEMGATEEAFAELAAKYSVDSSAADGGLIANICLGQTVEEFEDWCFDSSRKPGDSDIVKTTYGYHVMYFVGEAEEYYTFVVDNSIRTEAYVNTINTATEGIEVEELFGNRFIGKHLA